MLDCKSIATSMDANLNKLRDYASDSNLIDPTMYRQLIGSLMYLTNTRPAICFVVNALSRFMCEPRQTHWIATKHVLRYLRGTLGYGLRYDSECDLKLQGFTDSDWARCTTDRKSTLGCCFSLGSVATFHTPGSRGRNLQATWCVIGGKSRVKAVTLFLTPLFRLNS